MVHSPQYPEVCRPKELCTGTRNGRWWWQSLFWHSQHVQKTPSSHCAAVCGWTLFYLFSNSAFCWWHKYHCVRGIYLYSMLLRFSQTMQSLRTDRWLMKKLQHFPRWKWRLRGFVLFSLPEKFYLAWWETLINGWTEERLNDWNEMSLGSRIE